MKKKFTLEKKLVVQVRYFEEMFMLHDGEGIRVFTTTDEKMAKRVQAILNAYQWQRRNKKPKIKRRKK